MAVDHSRDEVGQRLAIRGHRLAGEEGAQVGGEFTDVLVALILAMGHGLVHDGDQPARQVAATGVVVDRLPLRADHLGDGAAQIAALVGRGGGQHLVEHDAEAVDVRAMVDAVELAAGLFGAHVGRRADGGAGDGLMISQAAELQLGGGLQQRLGRADHFGQTPIHDQDLAVGPDHEVARLEIAMHHATAVGEGHGVADLEEQLDDFETVLGRTGAPSQPVGEDDALDPFHGVEDRAVGQHADVVHRHHARVFELGGDLHLVQEAGGVLALDVPTIESLERHRALGIAVAQGEDHALRALAETSAEHEARPVRAQAAEWAPALESGGQLCLVVDAVQPPGHPCRSRRSWRRRDGFLVRLVVVAVAPRETHHSGGVAHGGSGQQTGELGRERISRPGQLGLGQPG